MKVINRLFAAVLALATTAVFAAVDVNNASVADLDSIKGIGPGTSAKILDARKGAKFKDWGDFIEACLASATSGPPSSRQKG